MATPERTKAIVVGIESYAAGSTWDLNGPAGDALRFLRYLSACGIPNANIRSYVEPLASNQGLRADVQSLSAEVAAPTQATLNDLIDNKLPVEDCDALLVYWAGHGYMTLGRERRLFTSDATTIAKRNIDLNSMLARLSSDTCPRIARVDAVIDTCANYVAVGTTGMSQYTFSAGAGVPGRAQFVLCAASPGEYARNLSAERAGLFSREFMGVVAPENAQPVWPLDLPDVALKLSARFEELRKNDPEIQAPSIVWMGSPTDTKESPLPGEDRSDKFFRRLGVFHSDFTFLACAAVNADFRTRDVQQRLKGLLATPALLSYDGVRRRYSLTETAGRAAAERLALSDEAETRKRLVAYIRTFVTVHERSVMSADRRGSIDQIEADLPDVMAAIDWSKKSPETYEHALWIGGSLFWFWNLSSRFAEGRACLRDLLEATKDAPRSAARAKALYAAGGLAFLEGSIESADTMLAESADIWRSLPEEPERNRWLGYTLVILGRIQHDFKTGAKFENDAERFLRDAKDTWGQALALNDLGYVRMTQGKVRDAKDNYNASLSLWRTLGDPWGLPLTLNNFGMLCKQQNQFQDAQQAHDEALRYQLGEGDRWGAAESLLYLADLAIKLENLDEAQACYRESFEMQHAVGRKQPAADCLLGLANVAVMRSPLTDEQAMYATRLLALWDRQTSQLKFVTTPETVDLGAQLKQKLQGKLGAVRFGSAWEDGQKTAPEDLVVEGVD